MALVSGGDLIEIACTNADAGNKTLYGVASEDSTLVVQGLKNDDNGAIDGAGRLIVSKNLKPGTFEGTISNNMADSTPELEYVQACMNSVNPTSFVFGWTNGKNYGGDGVFSGEPQVSGNKATFTTKITGNFKEL